MAFSTVTRAEAAATRMASADPMFEFLDVVVERDRVRALGGFSAAIPGQGVTVLAGPSGGSGKSTLLRLCNLFDVPTSGRVSFCGKDIAGIDPLWLRRQVGMCLQRPTPFDGTVADSVWCSPATIGYGRWVFHWASTAKIPLKALRPELTEPWFDGSHAALFAFLPRPDVPGHRRWQRNR